MSLQVVQMLEGEPEVVPEEKANQRVKAICSEQDPDLAVYQDQTLISENPRQICIKNPPT